MTARPQGLQSNRLRHPVGNGVPGRHNWSGTDERTCRFEPLGVPYGMQDEVKWSVSIVRTPHGWVGRYDTYGPKGKTVHMDVVPSLGQEVGAWVDEILAVKAEAEHKKAELARKEAIRNLRQSTPFVNWDELPYGPRQGSYTTYRQQPMFNEELGEDEIVDFTNWACEQGYDIEDEEEVVALLQVYREECEVNDSITRRHFWG